MTKGIPAAGLALTLLLSFPAKVARAHPGTGIAVDRQRRVYFTDLKRIWRWEPGGLVTAVVEGKHSHAIRLDADGSLVSEIHRRTPDGRIELLAGGAYGYADGVGGRRALVRSERSPSGRAATSMSRTWPASGRSRPAGASRHSPGAASS